MKKNKNMKRWIIGGSLLLLTLSGCATHDPFIAHSNKEVFAGDKENAIGAFHYIQKAETGNGISTSITLYFTALKQPHVFDLCPDVEPAVVGVTQKLKGGVSKKVATYDQPDCTTHLTVNSLAPLARYDLDLSYFEGYRISDVYGDNIHHASLGNIAGSFTSQDANRDLFLSDELRRDVLYIEIFE